MSDLSAATDALAAVLATLDDSDVERMVPACPGWSVRDLVGHVGHIHAWAAHAVLTGDPRTEADRLPPGAGGDEVARWYVERAGRLVEVLDATDPTAAAWTFSRTHQHAGFWHRRQLHEVLLHTRDLLEALGRVGEWVIEPELAWDGVREVREVFYPRQVELGRTEPLPRPLRLVPTDLTARPEVLGEGDDPVELAGPAVTLLLVLWHRLPCTDPDAAALTAHAVTP